MSSRNLTVGFIAPPRTHAQNADFVRSAQELRRHVRSRDLDAVIAWCKEEGGRVGINDRDKKGKTVLHISAQYGDYDILAFLLQIPGVQIDIKDEEGRTAMHWAAADPHCQCLFLFLDIGGLELAHLADADGSTALHLAVAADNFQATRVLVEAGCSQSISDLEGHTPLLLAARAGSNKIVELLLGHGGNVHHVDLEGCTALMLASKTGHDGVVSQLLAARADAAASDVTGSTALRHAVVGDRISTAALLAANLHSVDLSDSRVDRASPAARLAANVQTIDLKQSAVEEEKIVEICAAIRRAKHLDLRGNALRNFAACAIGRMQNLADTLFSLDLSANSISFQGEESLLSFATLTRLDLSCNAIQTLPQGFSNLTGLRWCSVRNNALSNIPSSLLAHCTQLNHLDASLNRISGFSESLSGMTSLVHLNLANNQLESLPQEIFHLKGLQVLVAHDNSLHSLPPLPPSIVSLDVSNNDIVELTPQLAELRGLARLQLERNKLDHLPANLITTPLRRTRALHATGNPLNGIPAHINHTPEELLGFLEDLYEGVQQPLTRREQVLFIRCMVLGEGGAGKTSLLRCLADPDMSLKSLLRQPRLPETGGSTLGVEVHRVEAVVRVCGAAVSLQFWDLAGQACYLVGHAMLLSERVIPVYVFDATKDELEAVHDAGRWLDTLLLTISPAAHAAGSATPQSPAPMPSTPSTTPTPSPQAQPMSPSELEDGGMRLTPPAQSSPVPSSSLQAAREPSTPHHGESADAGAGGEEEQKEKKDVQPVAIVIVGTRVESGLASREEAAGKLKALADGLVARTWRLHGRRLVVKALLGVSNATREGFEASAPKQTITFPQVLERIGAAALGVIYTDPAYPRGMVPVAYTRMREAFKQHATGPVMTMAQVRDMARQWGGITDGKKLERALAMLRCWGVLITMGDPAGPESENLVLQSEWCSELVYTLFMCAHFSAGRGQKKKPLRGGSGLGFSDKLPAHDADQSEDAVSEDVLRGRVDLDALAAADPGGGLIRKGIITKRAAEAMFSKVGKEAGVETCISLLEHVGLLSKVGRETYIAPSLFQNEMPAGLRKLLLPSKGRQWGTRREYRFNILPHRLASRLTVGLCAMADTRSGAAAVSTWGRGLWLQAPQPDASAVMIYSDEGGRTLVVNTIEVQKENRKHSPQQGWAMAVEELLAASLGQYQGIVVEAWLRCPEGVCGDGLPYARLAVAGGGKWERLGDVWDGEVVMCGALPVAHCFPPTVWVEGRLRRRGVDAEGGGEEKAWTMSAGGGAAEDEAEEGRVVSVSTAGSRALQAARGMHEGALGLVDGHHASHAHGATDGWAEAMELGQEVAEGTEEVSMMLMYGGTQHAMIVDAVSTCIGGHEAESQSIVSAVLGEVEEWAPVCKAVFGVLGCILLAAERKKNNEYNRQRFFERMVNLGRSLLDVRDTFARRPPPQMQAMLNTLQSALSFIQTFDERGWFMRVLKSGADKKTFERFEDNITGLCTDMSISLQVMAYRDEHRALREIVDRVGGIEALAANPAVHNRIEAIERMQWEQTGQFQSALTQILQRLPNGGGVEGRLKERGDGYELKQLGYKGTAAREESDPLDDGVGRRAVMGAAQGNVVKDEQRERGAAQEEREAVVEKEEVAQEGGSAGRREGGQDRREAEATLMEPSPVDFNAPSGCSYVPDPPLDPNPSFAPLPHPSRSSSRKSASPSGRSRHGAHPHAEEGSLDGPAVLQAPASESKGGSRTVRELEDADKGPSSWECR